MTEGELISSKHPRFQTLAGGDNFFQAHFGPDAKTLLRDNRAFIQMHADEMCCHADDFHAVLVGLAISLRPGKAGQ